MLGLIVQLGPQAVLKVLMGRVQGNRLPRFVMNFSEDAWCKVMFLDHLRGGFTVAGVVMPTAKFVFVNRQDAKVSETKSQIHRPISRMTSRAT